MKNGKWTQSAISSMNKTLDFHYDDVGDFLLMFIASSPLYFSSNKYLSNWIAFFDVRFNLQAILGKYKKGLLLWCSYTIAKLIKAKGKIVVIITKHGMFVDSIHLQI